MRCPECGGKTKVLDSRLLTANKKSRQRECLSCRHRFRTREIMMNGRRSCLFNQDMGKCQEMMVKLDQIRKILD